MTENLHDLYAAVDRLNPEEIAELRAYLDQHMTQSQIKDENVEARIDALHEAVKDFWDGIPEAEIDEIIEEMNSEYVEPSVEDEFFEEEDH